jgi:hypothetical protein
MRTTRIYNPGYIFPVKYCLKGKCYREVWEKVISKEEKRLSVYSPTYYSPTYYIQPTAITNCRIKFQGGLS